MNVTIVDYNSGNISSVINSFKEVAKDKVNIEVTSDLNKIKLSDKVVLPGQGSFKSCTDALNGISGLVDTLNEFAIIDKEGHSTFIADNNEAINIDSKEGRMRLLKETPNILGAHTGGNWNARRQSHKDVVSFFKKHFLA